MHCCQLTFIRAMLFSTQLPSPFSPVNADMRCAKVWFGRQRRGKTAWPKAKLQLLEAGQLLAGVHICLLLQTMNHSLVPTVTCTPHVCHFIKRPGSHSMPSSRLCSTWTKHSVTCSHLPPQMPTSLGITAGPPTVAGFQGPP